MAVGFSSSSESHTGSTGSSNEASFSWTHTQSGTPAGVLVFVFNAGDSTQRVTGVTYGTSSLTKITAAVAADSSGEPGRCDTYFLLGGGAPSGNQTITVSRTNNATVMYAVAASVTASAGFNTYVSASFPLNI